METGGGIRAGAKELEKERKERREPDGKGRKEDQAVY